MGRIGLSDDLSRTSGFFARGVIVLSQFRAEVPLSREDIRQVWAPFPGKDLGPVLPVTRRIGAYGIEQHRSTIAFTSDQFGADRLLPPLKFVTGVAVFWPPFI